MPRKKKEPTVPKKEPIVFTFEPFNEEELKEVVETSQKILTRNYVALIVALFTLLSLSVSFYLNSQTIKHNQKQTSEIENSIQSLKDLQTITSNSVDTLSSYIYSLDSKLEDVNLKLENVSIRLKSLNKMTIILDTLEQRTKSNQP